MARDAAALELLLLLLPLLSSSSASASSALVECWKSEKRFFSSTIFNCRTRRNNSALIGAHLEAGHRGVAGQGAWLGKKHCCAAAAQKLFTFSPTCAVFLPFSASSGFFLSLSLSLAHTNCTAVGNYTPCATPPWFVAHLLLLRICLCV